MGVTVFAAISKEHVIGPFFYTEPAPAGFIGPFFKPATVNGDRYLKMLQDFFLPKWNALQGSQHFHFMQDGAPPHFSLAVRAFLDQHLGNRWVGRGVQPTNLSWPPRSPDLTPCDFFLWGHIKELVYSRKPQSYYELVLYITEAFDSIDVATLQRVFDSIPNRYAQCVRENGKQQL